MSAIVAAIRFFGFTLATGEMLLLPEGTPFHVVRRENGAAPEPIGPGAEPPPVKRVPVARLVEQKKNDRPCEAGHGRHAKKYREAIR